MKRYSSSRLAFTNSQPQLRPLCLLAAVGLMATLCCPAVAQDKESTPPADLPKAEAVLDKMVDALGGRAVLEKFHNRVAKAIHSRSPKTMVGGPSSAWMQVQVSDFGLYRNQVRFMDLTRDRLDFYSHHFYEDFGSLGAVKQHSDIVLGIYREEMYSGGPDVEGATELIVAKNRSGPTGFIDLYFYQQWMRFEDMLDPDR